MTLFRRLIDGLRALAGRARVEDELDEELQGYFDEAVREGMAAGQSREHAARAARIRLGSPGVIKDQVRDAVWETRIEGLWQDARYAVRRLAKSPGFILVAAATLGLGIGANVAIFTLTYQVLLKPLPYENAEELVAIWGDASYRDVPNSEVSPANFRDWQQQATTFSGLSAYLQGGALILANDGGAAEVLDARQVDAVFFDVIGVQPIVGRGFLEEDDGEGAFPVAIVSHAFWLRRFGGAEDLSNAVLDTDRGAYDVVGVMPPGFQFGAPNTDVWVPLVLPESEWAESRAGGYLLAVGRLRRGVAIGQAQAEMDTIAANLAREHAEIDARRGVRLTPLREELAGGAGATYAVLFAAAGAVLLVACLNVAGLLLLRGARREHELATRRSLGASRLRLVQQLVAESACLALLGSLVGLVVSQWTFSFFETFVPARMAGLTVLGVDGSVLAFTVTIAVLTTLLAGVPPALRLSGLELSRATRGSGRAIGAKGHGRRLRGVLVVAEVGAAVILLVCSGLFIGTMMSLGAVDPGFEMDNLLTARILRRADVYDRVLERVRALPGVVDAGVGTTIPLTNYGGRRTLTIEGFVPEESDGRPRALFRTVGSGYLESLGVPLIDGRTLERTDSRDTQPVALVNESMSRRYWPGEDPIGRRVRLGAADSDNPWMVVVGVVGDMNQAALEVAPEPELILPYAQYDGAAYYSPGSLVVRAAGNPDALAEAIRREIEAVDSSAPGAVQTMSRIAASGLEERRLRTILISGFASLALALSILGVYAIVSFAVADRTGEIGIRLALGAHPGAILRMMLREGLVPAAIGCAVGLLSAVAVTWTLERFLWGVTPRDPVSFLAVAMLTILVASVASYIPARRITKINPLDALRHE